VIREPITGGRGQISGRFTAASATDLSVLLRAGALPVPLKIIEERTVGPDLGADSIRAGIAACVVGMLLVMGLINYLGPKHSGSFAAALALLSGRLVRAGSAVATAVLAMALVGTLAGPAAYAIATVGVSHLGGGPTVGPREAGPRGGGGWGKGVDSEDVDPASFKTATKTFADSGYRMRSLLKGLVTSGEFFQASPPPAAAAGGTKLAAH